MKIPQRCLLLDDLLVLVNGKSIDTDFERLLQSQARVHIAEC